MPTQNELLIPRPASQQSREKYPRALARTPPYISDEAGLTPVLDDLSAIHGHNLDHGQRDTLADELADLWDHDADSDDEMSTSDTSIQDENVAPQPDTATQQRNQSHATTITDIGHKQGLSYSTNLTIKPYKSSIMASRLVKSQDEDQEVDCCKDVLQAIDIQLQVIEELIRSDVTNADTREQGGHPGRLAQSLRNLPAQGTIETFSSRLITTHTALAVHLNHQFKSLQSLVHPIVSPISTQPDVVMVDEILPLISDLLLCVPAPSPLCITGLQAFRQATMDLQINLDHLSDSIDVTRQDISLASRKLRSAIEIVSRMRQEDAQYSEAVEFIGNGDWQARIKGRACGRACQDVILGFDEKFQLLRQGLFNQAASVKHAASA